MKNLILTLAIAGFFRGVDARTVLDYEIFSNNQKVGVARYIIDGNYIRGVKIYGYLGKTVIDSVTGIFDNRVMPVRTRRHEIVDLKYRGSMDYSSEAFYLPDAIQISLGSEDTVIYLDARLPIIDFDFLMFQLPHIFEKLRTGDSASFYLVFPMGKRVERCTALVGKGEMVFFSGDTIATVRIHFTRPGYKSPISVWITPEGTPIRYYDAASGYQMFLIPKQPSSTPGHQGSRKTERDSKAE